MSLIILNDWFVNEDKSITFYDTTRHKECCTNKTKSVAPAWALSNPSNKEVKLVQMYEHHLSGTTSNFKVYPSEQFDGFQVYFKSSKMSLTLALSLNRRVREGKEFLQTKEEVEVLFGLREAPVVESVDHADHADQVEPVAELESIVVQ
jgi:hypothetical protein